MILNCNWKPWYSGTCLSVHIKTTHILAYTYTRAHYTELSYRENWCAIFFTCLCAMINRSNGIHKIMVKYLLYKDKLKEKRQQEVNRKKMYTDLTFICTTNFTEHKSDLCSKGVKTFFCALLDKSMELGTQLVFITKVNLQ